MSNTIRDSVIVIRIGIELVIVIDKVIRSCIYMVI